jgi:hypothetical protein
MNSKVLFDEDGWKRLQDEVPKMKLITPSALVERLKINGSLARAACKYLLEVRRSYLRERVSAVAYLSSFRFYRRARSPRLKATTPSRSIPELPLFKQYRHQPVFNKLASVSAGCPTFSCSERASV